MSGQRARSAIAAEHRSMISTISGVPSWGAVLIAVTFTAIGFAFDAGSGGRQLTHAFAAAYAVGCVAAVVAVRQTGVFTAVIQPPLILFVCVPGAYFLFHGGSMDGLKDLLINCGYPLIERFPLMFFTSAIVLLIGLLRWYIGMSSPRTASAEATEAAGAELSNRFATVAAKISGLLSRETDDEDAVDDEPPRLRSKQHSFDRAAKTAKSARNERASTRTRSGRPTKRTQPSRSRHTRPPETEIIEPVVERPRRARTARRATDPSVPPSEPRRRTKSSSTRSSSTRSSSTRSSSSREPRKQPPASERRSGYKRPDRHSRFEGFDGFEPFEPHGTNGSNGNGSLNGTHHPISRVRYRGGDEGDQRSQYRARPRAARHQAEAWEYDV
ncbi:hypothetical protein A5662_12195 [Mycobacteriaceae bacterium 1482268.1]|nr:hypothetical protein A5662_12195 [Mycobacteriaceae bacterium 1482268.1]